MSKKRLYLPVVLFLVVALAACNLPTPQPQAGPDAVFTAAAQTVVAQLTNAASTQAPPPGSGPAVKITSPAGAATVPGSAPLQVQFTASGGPFIEADLLVDNQPVASLALASDNQSPSGALAWNTPTAGSHILTVQVITAEKMLYATTAQIVVQGQPAAFTPTASVPPAATATSTQICDQALFVTDVTVPDGTNFEPGATFTKTWRLKNNGVCSWTPSYTLAFDHGDAMGGPSSVALTGNFNPGATMDISVNLTAPSTAGNYTGYWKLRNASGVSFMTITVVIHVGDVTGGAFRVIHVTYSQSGGCGAFHVVADVQTNGPGTVTYYWLYSDGGTDGATHAPLVFSAAGAQSVETDWAFSGTTRQWMKLYINEPNHQAIGQVDLVCP